MQHRHKSNAHDPVVSQDLLSRSSMKIPRSRRHIGRMKNSFRFEVRRVLAKRGKDLVSHLEVLPFSIEIPVAVRPFNVSAHGSRGQVLRFSFTAAEQGFLAVEVRSSIGRKAEAQSPPDGVTDSARPVSVLI